ncbi:unnamed protein product, partial [Ectocarpus sp. 12 AP-2014]
LSCPCSGEDWVLLCSFRVQMCWTTRLIGPLIVVVAVVCFAVEEVERGRIIRALMLLVKMDFVRGAGNGIVAQQQPSSLYNNCAVRVCFLALVKPSPDVVRRLFTLKSPLSTVCTMMFGGSSLPLPHFDVVDHPPNQIYVLSICGCLRLGLSCPCRGEEWEVLLCSFRVKMCWMTRLIARLVRADPTGDGQG